MSAEDLWQGRRPQAFTIAGKDGKFVPATARIDKDTLLRSSRTSPNPRQSVTLGKIIPKAAIFTTAMACRRAVRTDKNL